MSDGDDEPGEDEPVKNPGFDAPEVPDRQDAVVDADRGGEAQTVGAEPTPAPPGAGAPDDEEMPLAVHIEEMIKRLGIVLIIAGGVAALAFPFGEAVINFLWYSLLPDSAPPVLYKPLELVLTQMKVASLVGLIAALPVFVYETYLFMRPGLYPHERRYYLAAIPTSLVLAFVGIVFAYFVVLPAVFTYFLNYTEQTARVAFALGQTMDLILILMAYLALVFQIPLFVMLAMMMGLVTREWLVGRRLLFWGAFAGISFIFSPDPTGMSPLLIAVTMIVLFEGTLLLAKWTGRGKRSGWG
jgi:sec-independent protein translocase protein TatC